MQFSKQMWLFVQGLETKTMHTTNGIELLQDRMCA